MKVHPIPHAIFETKRSGFIHILHHCSVPWKITQLVVSKMTRIWRILIWALKSLNNKLHFDWSLLWKVYNVWPKKYRGAIFHDAKMSGKIWGKTDLWFGKWQEEFGKFLPEHMGVSNLGHWQNPFVQNKIYMSKKNTEELCVMGLKNDEKFEEKLTYIRNLTNFDSSTWKSQN